MEFHGHIKNGRLSMSGVVREAWGRFLASLPDGAAVRVKVEKIGRPKSHQQVKAFWALVMPSARELFHEQGWDVMGVPLCDEQIKDVLYELCGKVGDNSEKLAISRMTTLQMATFFENCRSFLAQFGKVVPDPDPAWRVKT